MKLKYKVCLTFIIVLLVILTSIGRSYAVWVINEKQTGVNLVETGCLNIVYNDLNKDNISSNITLINTYPIPDSVGKGLTPYKVTIENKCTLAANYNLYLSSFASNDLPEGNLKVYFGRVDDNTVWGPHLLSSMATAIINDSLKKELVVDTGEQIKNSYVLASGILNPTESKTYELRMWVSEESTNEVMKKKFKSIIFMEATAVENHL